MVCARQRPARAQERAEDALGAYSEAVAITPTDYESHLGRAGVLATLERYAEEVEAYRAALRIKPEDVKVWLNVGVALSIIDDAEQAEAAFREAALRRAQRGRPPLNLGRYLAKLAARGGDLPSSTARR